MSMSKSQFLIDTVDALPDLGMIKIGTMLRKHDILVGLEKTAEVGTRLAERENEIIADFYKLSAKAPPGFFGGMGKAVGAVFDPKSAAKSYKLMNKGTTAEAAAKASETLGGRLGIAGNRVARTARQNPLATGIAGGTAAGVGGYMVGRDRPQQNVVIKTGELLREGGRQFLKAMNPWAKESDHAESLDKIAAIGELNAKLNLILADTNIRQEIKEEAVKLGQDNHRECIATLKKLSSKKKSLTKTAEHTALPSSGDANNRDTAGGRMQKSINSTVSGAVDAVTGLFSGSDSPAMAGKFKQKSGGTVSSPGNKNFNDKNNIVAGPDTPQQMAAKAPSARSSGGAGSIPSAGGGGSPKFDDSTSAGRKAHRAAVGAPPAGGGGGIGVAGAAKAGAAAAAPSHKVDNSRAGILRESGWSDEQIKSISGL